MRMWLFAAILTEKAIVCKYLISICMYNMPTSWRSRSEGVLNSFSSDAYFCWAYETGNGSDSIRSGMSKTIKNF
jgi:hypothetical protein